MGVRVYSITEVRLVVEVLVGRSVNGVLGSPYF